jgi:hypothetical protein
MKLRDGPVDFLPGPEPGAAEEAVVVEFCLASDDLVGALASLHAKEIRIYGCRGESLSLGNNKSPATTVLGNKPTCADTYAGVRDF